MKYIISIIALLCLCGVIIIQSGTLYRFEDKNAVVGNSTPLVVVVEVIEVVYESKADLITRLAQENNFNVRVALKIAHCESKTGTQNFNKHSSAKGIYQILDKTWKNYCVGDVLDDYDNINCFLKLYEKHKGWWECKA